MTSTVKQQRLLKQLEEIGNCFSKPEVPHSERLQKCAQLKSCISTVEKVCTDLRDSQEALKAGSGGSGGSAALLQQKLDEATAGLEREQAKAKELEATLQRSTGRGSSAAEVRQLTNRITQLEKDLQERTEQLEETASRLGQAGGAKASGREQALLSRVAALTTEVNAKAAEVEEMRGQLELSQKQLWQTREMYNSLKEAKESETARHTAEMDRMRHQLEQLHQISSQPNTPDRFGPDSPRSRSIHDDELTPADSAHHRRQLAMERQENARLRRERDEARSELDHQSAELRRTQVSHCHRLSGTWTFPCPPLLAPFHPLTAASLPRLNRSPFHPTPLACAVPPHFLCSFAGFTQLCKADLFCFIVLSTPLVLIVNACTRNSLILIFSSCVA